MAKRISVSSLAFCWVALIAWWLPGLQAPLLSKPAGGEAGRITFDAKDALAGWTITGDVTVDLAKGRGGARAAR